MLRHGCGLRPWASPPGSRGVRGRTRPTPALTDRKDSAYRLRSPTGPNPLRGVRWVTAAKELQEGGKSPLPEDCQRGGSPQGSGSKGSCPSGSREVPGFSDRGSAGHRAAAALVTGWAETCPRVCLDPRGGDEGSVFERPPGAPLNAGSLLFCPP